MKSFIRAISSLYVSLIVVCGLGGFSAAYAKAPVVLMTDFGLTDGAVSAMKGVIYSVDQNTVIADLTHNIQPFNIHEASYRLYQVMQYYPVGTVFVTVIDPGVGTARKSIVAKTKNGYYIVTPDNGMLTHVALKYGIEEIREIDEKLNRLPQSFTSHTFYGRDVYAYTGGRLGADVIKYEEVGNTLPVDKYVKLPINLPVLKKDGLYGSVITLDGVYGNVWTNFDEELLEKAGIKSGHPIQVTIANGTKTVYQSKILFGKTFGEVKVGQPIAYMNSVANLAIALNQRDFAKKYGVKAGYTIRITAVKN